MDYLDESSVIKNVFTSGRGSQKRQSEMEMMGVRSESFSVRMARSQGLWAALEG